MYQLKRFAVTCIHGIMIPFFDTIDKSHFRLTSK
jgi:hypothetical protein